MDEQIAPTKAENSAWAEFATPFDVQKLKAFCVEDVERLFRINPYLEFTKWEKIADRQFHMVGNNISQGEPVEFDYEFTVAETDDGLKVTYKNALKLSTTFKVDVAEQGSKLTIIDEYADLSEKEAAERAKEVDQSLVTWANYLQRYMLTWKKWSWLSPWRWYMRKLWQPMKPMSRRICYMLWWITLFEIALIALGVAVYFAEYA